MGNFDSNDFNRNQSNLHILWLRPALFWPVVNKRVTENLADVIATLLRFFFYFFYKHFRICMFGTLSNTNTFGQVPSSGDKPARNDLRSAIAAMPR